MPPVEPASTERKHPLIITEAGPVKKLKTSAATSDEESQEHDAQPQIYDTESTLLLTSAQQDRSQMHNEESETQASSPAFTDGRPPGFGTESTIHEKYDVFDETNVELDEESDAGSDEISSTDSGYGSPADPSLSLPDRNCKPILRKLQGGFLELSRTDEAMIDMYALKIKHCLTDDAYDEILALAYSNTDDPDSEYMTASQARYRLEDLAERDPLGYYSD